MPGYLLYQGGKLINVTSVRRGAAAAQSTVAVRLSCLPLGAFPGRAGHSSRVRARACSPPARARPSVGVTLLIPKHALSSRLDPDKVSGGAEGCAETGMVRHPLTM